MSVLAGLSVQRFFRPGFHFNLRPDAATLLHLTHKYYHSLSLKN
jgi:hypothetical protein